MMMAEQAVGDQQTKLWSQTEHKRFQPRYLADPHKISEDRPSGVMQIHLMGREDVTKEYTCQT